MLHAFPQTVFDTQATFRSVLNALARPGTVHPIAGTSGVPQPFSPDAAAIALALCDHDTPVWLDAELQSDQAVGAWLRFHCGCPLVTDPQAAAFAFAADVHALPPFGAFSPGTTEYPDRSTTLILQVHSLETGPCLELAGPGIRDRASLCASPLPSDMRARMTANRALFPRGIDILLVAPGAVAGLPRSVRLVED